MSGFRLPFLVALIALFPLPAVLLPGHAAAVVGCPLSTLNCNGLSSSDDAVRDLTCFDSQGGGGVGYDLVSGRLYAGGQGYDGSGGGSVQAVDDYTILGLATGTPVTFTARIRVVGFVSVGCAITLPSGDIFGRLTEGQSNVVEVRKSSTLGECQPFGGGCCAVGASVDSTLRLSIAGTAGVAFRLTSEVGASVRFGSANVTGQLSFEDLPPGSAVVSCQGFRHDAPVAAVPASWGAVKVRYR